MPAAFRSSEHAGAPATIYMARPFKYLDGRAMYVVAGAPACSEDLKAAGIENFIHVRVNQLETLKEYNAKLGI